MSKQQSIKYYAAILVAIDNTYCESRRRSLDRKRKHLMDRMTVQQLRLASTIAYKEILQ